MNEGPLGRLEFESGEYLHATTHAHAVVRKAKARLAYELEQCADAI